jgi:EAL domain-containing protein (putative c-di-GMP-specific phosphodiesterase class I)
VKIDGALIADASRDENAGIVMRAIVRLAHELFMVVTAEGVETDLQLDHAVFSECDFAQGTFLCGPRAPVDLERFLADVAVRAGSGNTLIERRRSLTPRAERTAPALLHAE